MWARSASDSSDDANRRFVSQTPVYRWRVENAARFGFVNYVFEPWHWEWRGVAPAAIATLDSGAPARQ
jgi:LAS superfamily LD-carboxypeptidase LdcB